MLSKLGGSTIPLKNKLVELYEFRNMVRAQIVRNLFGRYKNSLFGFAWNFITPLIYIVLCYIIFSEISQSTIENYLIFLASGIFIYSFILGGITSGASIFTGNSGMIKKMYFPREILVISQAISALIIASIGYTFVFIIALCSGIALNLFSILTTLIMLSLGFLFFIGCSLLFGSISVYVRDVQYLLGSISIAFFVCTPIRTMMSDANGIILEIYKVNPLTYFVEPMHQAIYFAESPDLIYVGIAGLITLFILVIGYAVFWRLKRGFVERL